MDVVGIILDRLAHGTRVRRGKPRKRRPSKHFHHAGTHNMTKTNIRKMGNSKRKEVNAIARTKCSKKPHEKVNDLTTVRRNTHASRCQKYLAELDENDVGSNCERSVKYSEYLREGHGSTNRSGQFFKRLLSCSVRSARILDFYFNTGW